MFSLVKNISSALNPLVTEAVDARLGKNHDNADEINKDHSKNSDSQFDYDKENFNIISIGALILFLENTLETHLNSTLHLDEIESKPEFSSWFEAKQSNDSSVELSNAASAYEHAASTSHTRIRKISQPLQPELKNIYALIKDLRHLQNSGVKHLNLKSEDALISGIIAAVKNIK